MAVQHQRRELPRPFQQLRVGGQVGEAQQRRARLARAQEFARAADLQVAPRDLEAVGGLGHGLQPRARRLAQAAAFPAE